jgi:phage terminase small subunit
VEVVVDEIDGELSPAEAACTPLQRRFVHWLMSLPPKPGSRTQAAKLAGYGQHSTPRAIADIARKLLHSQRVIDLITEVTRKQIRSSAPEALAAVREIIGDPAHRDRLKAAETVLERIEPVRQRLDVNVKHEVVNREQEAVEYLRKLKQLGVSREKLEAELGYSDLPRYERLLALEDTRKGITQGRPAPAQAEVIETTDYTVLTESTDG